MVLHKITQHGSTCSAVKEHVDILRIVCCIDYFSAPLRLSRLEIYTFQAENLVLTTVTDSGAESSKIFFYLTNSYSQKVKPCGRTTQFSAGLHCQAKTSALRQLPLKV
jgi:hypothetical protein